MADSYGGNHNLVQHLTGLKRRGKLRGKSETSKKAKKKVTKSKSTSTTSDSDYY